MKPLFHMFLGVLIIVGVHRFVFESLHAYIIMLGLVMFALFRYIKTSHFTLGDVGFGVIIFCVMTPCLLVPPLTKFEGNMIACTFVNLMIYWFYILIKEIKGIMGR